MSVCGPCGLPAKVKKAFENINKFFYFFASRSRARQTLRNPYHGYGFSGGCEMKTHTRTPPTHTRNPSRVHKPVTIPTNATSSVVNPPIESQTTQPLPNLPSASSQEILNQAIEAFASNNTLSEDELLAAFLFFTSGTEASVRAARTFVVLNNNQVVQRRFLIHQLGMAGLLPAKGKGKAAEVQEDDDDLMMY
jgi:hypothetical protein